MPLTATLANATPEQNELSLALVPGLIGLAGATAAQALAPVLAGQVAVLVPFLLCCALLQIGVGLFEWRRERIFFAVTFTAFGLFTCAQISQLGIARADGAGVTGAISLLVLWSLFALLLACGVERQGRLIRTLLGAVAATLLVKALLVAGAAVAWPLAVVAALATVLLAGYACVRALDPPFRS